MLKSEQPKVKMAKKERKFFGIIYYVDDGSSTVTEKFDERQKPTLSAWLVVFSWLISWTIFGIGLFSTPDFRKYYQGQEPGIFNSTLAICLLVAVFCGWPWLLAYIKAYDPAQRFRVLAFSIATIIISMFFYGAIARSPVEGVGHTLILGVLSVWLAYPLSRIFGSR